MNVKHNTARSEDDIYNYTGKIRRLKRQFGTIPQGDAAVRFLEHLKISGIRDGRICYYGDRMALILRLYGKKFAKTRLKNVKKHHCESILSEIISNEAYSGETKKAYALALLKFIHFVKTGEIGTREDGYAKEVSWIKPSRYLDKNEVTVRPEDLLTADEVVALLGKISNKRDRAMYWVLFEGAFRTGELLKFKVGGIDFKDDHVLVTTHGGKTGSKRVALVLSFKPLLEWLREHPERDNPDAFLWHSTTSRSGVARVSYSYLRCHLRQYATDAGITKKVWLYLMRHTQLTLLAKKLSDQTLRVYGNWSPNSNMAKKYVHLSGKDIDEAILEMHGIRIKDDSNGIIRLDTCPRCSTQNTPDNQRCSQCGYILDGALLPQDAKTQQGVIDEMNAGLERIRKVEKKLDLIFGELLKQKSLQT